MPEHDGKILIRMPGTGVMVSYASKAERDQATRLAQSRQRIAERTGYIPAWDELDEGDRETAILEARNWLRAAAECGLLAEPGAVTEWGARFRDGDGSLSRLVDCGHGTEAEQNARSLAGTSKKDDLTGIVLRREVGPWKEAPDA